MALTKEKKFVDAYALFESAAKQGHVDAQVQLGRMHANGMGVAQSYMNAHIWYDIAAINGSSPAIFGRRNAFKRLSEADVAEAQRLARLCVDSRYQDCM